MSLELLEITTLLGFLIWAAKGPSNKKKLKYARPDKTKMSDQYVINKYGGIEELLNKQ